MLYIFVSISWLYIIKYFCITANKNLSECVHVCVCLWFHESKKTYRMIDTGCLILATWAWWWWKEARRQKNKFKNQEFKKLFKTMNVFKQKIYDLISKNTNLFLFMMYIQTSSEGSSLILILNQEMTIRWVRADHLNSKHSISRLSRDTWNLN